MLNGSWPHVHLQARNGAVYMALQRTWLLLTLLWAVEAMASYDTACPDRLGVLSRAGPRACATRSEPQL